LGYVDALLILHEASRPDHPAEGAFHDPSAGQSLEAFLIIGSADDLDDRIEIACFFPQFATTIGTVSEEMLDAYVNLSQ